MLLSRPMLAAAMLLGLIAPAAGQQTAVVIGSKNFTEGYVLGEIMAQMIESRGTPVIRKYGFAGTLVAFEALKAGEIDTYAEYSGTIAQAILGIDAELENGALAQALMPLGLEPLASFGFNNTYAVAVTPELADALGLEQISDLGAHPELRLGFSHEFRDRPDGWPGLQRAYDLPQQSSGIEHGLAFGNILDFRTLIVVRENYCFFLFFQLLDFLG